MKLPDIQETEPNIKIKLNRVGISKLKMPILISEKSRGFQHSVADVSCYVDLAADKKGINMSRIPQHLQNGLNNPINSTILKNIANKIRINSNAEVCQLKYEFD